MLRSSFCKIVGFVLIIFGIFSLVFGFCKRELSVITENSKIEMFFDGDVALADGYIAVLEIPKINLMKGLYSISSEYNDVNYGIEIVDSSSFPDKPYGNLILASHSGSSDISFFKNLDDMDIGDSVFVYYNDFKYEFVLSNIYDVKKDGDVEIVRNMNMTSISLITCNTSNDFYQTVYIGYLKN